MKKYRVPIVLMSAGKSAGNSVLAQAGLLLCLFVIFTSVPLQAGPELQPLSNQLKHHASPYLALHGNDPVNWQDWGAAIVKRAKTENKLIFISSGYFSCHWCHVMQRESYSDKDIADLLNQLAIPVKVDRELHPALDGWLIDFATRTNGHAGWPLNAFLTPDGYPLVALTYRPKKEFSELLKRLQNLWHNNETELREMARKSFVSIKSVTQTHSGKRPQDGADRELVQLMLMQTMQIADETAGGFGQQNKFPMSPLLKSLVEVQASFPDEKLAEFLKLTLDQMALLGLRDHIGGGFFRYTVDPAWDTPHFEKMLYDNAQLIDVYLSAGEVLEQPFYREVALDTLDFVIEVMAARDSAPEGGYIASLSAVDSNNIEGGYYLWQPEELESVLDEDELKIISLIWGIQGSPHLDAGFHLSYVKTVDEAAGQLKLPASDVSTKLAQARNKLQQVRTQRQIPADSKVLAAWNGLLLSSMSNAYSQTGSSRYRKAAVKLYQLLANGLWDGVTLQRFIHDSEPGGKVSLADYAYVSQGILSWARVTDDKQALNTAKQIALAGLLRFHNDSGWQLSEELVIPYAARELVLTDDTMPSPSATLLRVLYTIASMQQDDKLKQRISRYLDVDFPAMKTSPLWYGSQILLIHHVLYGDS